MYLTLVQFRELMMILLIIHILVCVCVCIYNSVKVYYTYSFIQLPLQWRYRTVPSTQAPLCSFFVSIPTTLIFSLSNFIISRILYKWNHTYIMQPIETGIFSLIIITLRFIHIVVRINSSFLSIAEHYSTV